ncbi:MAG TPA: hypothetical protein VK824_05720 [Planctomycetota bacterium]|nr:hypothetical protein [Planctomycetota bacterium]
MTSEKHQAGSRAANCPASRERKRRGSLAAALLLASLAACSSTSGRISTSSKLRFFSACAHVAQIVAQVGCKL